MRDTKITRDLFIHGCKKGHLLYFDMQHEHWPTVKFDTSHWRETVEYLGGMKMGVEGEPSQETVKYLEVVRSGV